MSLVEILEKSQQAATQSLAEAQLKEAEESNFGAYVVELSRVLASEGVAPESVRALAGVLLKLAFSAQSEAFQQKKTERWLGGVSEDQRTKCKAQCLATLVSKSASISRAAAQAVAAIAQIEMPVHKWPDVITSLTKNAGANNDLAPEQKVASLQALGYICEVVAVDLIPPEQVNEILNTIGNAMSDSLPEKLYLAATTAMLNTLEFASQNMSNQNERNMILTLIVQATKSKYESVRTKGYECIVRTASRYYEFLGEYMTGLYESTFQAVKTDSEPVAMQALEFWTSLAEEELYLQEEEPSKCARYINKVAQQLSELLMNFCLIKQEEDQDEDTRNLATAGAMCLGYMSQCLSNDILPLVLPFVENNIHNEDWHRREAAVLAFGAMLDGPSPEVIRGPLLAAFETVLSKMLPQYEKQAMVRDTAAWAVSVVCNDHINMLEPSKHLEPLVKSLIVGLDDVARVARNVAFAIHNLARAFSPVANEATNKLSPLFQTFVSKLLLVTERADRNDWELAQNAYEAINNLVENAAKDMFPLIFKLLEEVLRRLTLTVEKIPNTSEEKEERDQLQMFLCGNIQVMVMKLQTDILTLGTQGQVTPPATAPATTVVPDKIVELMIKLLRIPNAPCHSDCFMVLGATANAIESNFGRYLPHLMELVCIGLNNHEEYQVCQNAVGCVGDICRAVEDGIDIYCDKIMEILHNNLKAEHLNRDVKPPTLAVFGDIALAIGPKFERFLRECFATIFAAAQTQVDADDEDMVEYLNTLRENILEACTGIIQGVNGDATKGISPRPELLTPYCEPILQFVAMIAGEVAVGSETNMVSINVAKGAVGVMGDLCDVMGPRIKEKIVAAKQFVEPLFRQCAQSGDINIRQTAQWASQVCGLAA